MQVLEEEIQASDIAMINGRLSQAKVNSVVFSIKQLVGLQRICLKSS